MPGQPVPPVFVQAFALAAPACTPATAIAGGKTYPFPAASQIAILNGAASLNDGFVPLNMTDPLAGGVPPFGVDENGILYLLSAHIVALQAGQPYQWSATLEAAMGGYALGAVLQQIADPTAFWISTIAVNISNPDAGGGGWVSSKPLYATTALTAGAHNDFALPGPSNYFLDIDTTAGAINITGETPQRDMQCVTYTNIGANLLTFNALNGGSVAAHQNRVPTDLALLQNQSLTLQYVTAIGKWVQA